jgi:uncharacterized protein YndB with AHSA1/START domain
MENKLIIERIFDAPIHKLWNAWSEPKSMMKWWGPKPFKAPFIKMDFRVGGKILWCMRDKKGKDYWNSGTFLKVDPMKRIIYTDHFADKDGKIVPASAYGMTGEWPDELKVTVQFEDVGGKTQRTLTHAGVPPGEMADLTRAAWETSFDKLAKSLK